MPLLPSERHTKSDLATWREYEEADAVHGQWLMRSSKVDHSIEAIKSFGTPAFVGVSWGKDSVVVAHLAWKAGIRSLRNLRCNNRNPECDVVRDAYLSAFPSEYQEVTVDYGQLHATGLPQHELDRATDQRWYAAIDSMGHEFGGRHILGIRADESGGRKIRMRRWGTNSPKGCAPIGWWTIADVFGYLSYHGLPIHPAYAMSGGGRWARKSMRVAEIGDTHGSQYGRREWEQEYYGDVLRRIEAGKST